MKPTSVGLWAVHFWMLAVGCLCEDRVSLELTAKIGSNGTNSEMVSKLMLKGPPGGFVRVEWTENLLGPWTAWSNIVLRTDGVELLDSTPGPERRFYRAVSEAKPVGPSGFVWISPGTFVMGSPLSETERWDDEVQHTVTLTQGFWLSDHEVTQGEYQAVMLVNPSIFKRDDNWPVEGVSWSDAVLYCQRLTEHERAVGSISALQYYRLPTEAEWEYAARAGVTAARHGELDSIGWWIGNIETGTHPVKQKAANAWGLYDMMGNVWEWCSDWYGAYPTGRVSNPKGPSSGSSRVFRGGSWANLPWYARSACRGDLDPNYQSLGFRPVLDSVNTMALTLAITENPQPMTVTAGNTARFSVTATGKLPLTYQWQCNSSNLPGATAATYTVVNAQLANSGEYRVVVFNSTGSVTSAPVRLTVNPVNVGGPSGFIWIIPGTFVMGSPSNEQGRESDEVQHTVTLTQGFWLSDHEVTQGEYQAVTGTNPSTFKGSRVDLSLPVETVSWDEAVEYCRKLTERERTAGRITAQQAYRLPTEAEWEYAARAGTTGARHGQLDSIAWWIGNSVRQISPVKRKAPNAWGLYDMMGNVREWCLDWWGDYPTGSVTNPTGPSSGSDRVFRGGSWLDDAGWVRSAFRLGDVNGSRDSLLGFRPAISSIPTIIEQPQSVTVIAEQTAQFTVTVTGAEPLAYQWQRNGTNLIGATMATYTVVNVQPSNAGDYRVVVSSLAGTVTSLPAKLTVNQVSSVGPSGFVRIAPGTFVMGSSSSDPGHLNDEVEHAVTLTQGFWLSDHEVTQGEYQEVMGNNPSHFTGDLNLPVETVSWDEAVEYCRKLTERERTAGRITAQQAYRLPTEAEWEYAARAGSLRVGYVDAWWFVNSGGQTHPVKQKEANAWKLYDMMGNVWEWCSDWYGAYPTGSVTDPTGPSSGSTRVLRGASWGDVGPVVRSALRNTGQPVTRGSSIGFRPALSSVRPEGAPGFVWITPGNFVMGSPSSEPDRDFNEVQHTVTLTQGFWLSDHEVTQGEYQTVMGKNPSQFTGNLNLPVETVSWDEAVEYCRKLTERERAAGRITAQQVYRLPTEAEWEYAARAGTPQKRYGDLDAIAWWFLNSGGQTHPVKQKAANAWGLYDMIGNVWEWCSDWYGAYPTASVMDPSGSSTGFERVFRGGSWGSFAGFERSAYRNMNNPGNRNSDLGFRPALCTIR